MEPWSHRIASWIVEHLQHSQITHYSAPITKHKARLAFGPPYSSSLALLELSFGLKIWVEFISKEFFSLHFRNLLAQPRHLLVVIGPFSDNPPGCWQLGLLVLQIGAMNVKDFWLKLIGDMHLREGIVAKVKRLGILQTLLTAPCFTPKPLLWQAFNWDLK